MQGPETRLRKRIVKALVEKYPKAYIRKIHGNAFQNIGVPDLLCCFNGIFIGMEIKIPGEVATRVQEFELLAIVKSGGEAGVVTSIEEAMELAEKATRRKK